MQRNDLRTKDLRLYCTATKYELAVEGVALMHYDLKHTTRSRTQQHEPDRMLPDTHGHVFPGAVGHLHCICSTPRFTSDLPCMLVEAE